MPRTSIVSGSDGGAREPKGIQSLETGMQVLDALARAPGPLSLKAISEAAGLPPSNVHRYLASFIRAGMVYQDRSSGHYDLGDMALRVGLAALTRLDFVGPASNALKSLTEHSDKTSMLTVWGDQGPTIIRWQRGSRPLVTSLSLGSVLPVLTSATSHVLLAFMPPARMHRHLDDALAAGQGSGSHDVDDIHRRIAEARRSRLARVEGGVIPGLRAASSPILDLQGEPVAAITVLDSMAAPVEQFDAAVEQMLAVTAGVSAQLGWPAAV